MVDRSKSLVYGENHPESLLREVGFTLEALIRNWYPSVALDTVVLCRQSWEVGKKLCFDSHAWNRVI